MFVKKMIAKRKEKIETQKRDKLTKNTGIYFSVELEAEKRRFPFLKYLLNAFILFGGTYGSLMCFASSFDMEIYVPILVMICISLSIIFAGMYIYKWTKYVAYLAILFMSIFFLTDSYRAINSGMSAIFNICLDRINDVFPLPKIKNYSEFIDDRVYTVTMALCVISLLMMLILNIVVSEYMNVILFFLFTFPLMQIGLYFGFQPDVFPMIILMGSWLIVLVMRMTGAYDGLSNKMSAKTVVKKNVHHYGFVTDPGNCAMIGITAGGVILAFILVLGLLVPKKDFAISTFADRWKEATNQPVKNVLTYGLASLFPSNSVRGAAGDIANVKSISFDGKTDLEVTMANIGEDRYYLKSFTGQEYLPYRYKWTNNSFAIETDTISYGATENADTRAYYNLPAEMIKFDMENEKKLLPLKHKVEVKIVDDQMLDQGDLLVPYYALSDSDMVLSAPGTVFAKSPTDTMVYTTYSMNLDVTNRRYFEKLSYLYTGDDVKKSLEVSKDYYENVILEYYLQVPEENKEVLKEICKQHGFRAEDPDVVRKVVEMLRDEYDYTVKPGRVPGGEEYVNYFLTNNKKGYCVHFATSATLLFRYLGIPARYVEGYVVDWYDMVRGEVLTDEDAANWLEGGNVENIDVVRASISDANGHAWVEIYYPDFGWVPIEVTNSASIDSGDDSILSGIFGGGFRLPRALENSMNQVNAENIAKTTEKLKSSGFLFALIFVLAYLIRMGVFVLPRKLHILREDKKGNPYPRYMHLQSITDFDRGGDRVTCSYKEFTDRMQAEEILTSEEGKKLLHQIEYFLYSGKEKNMQEYEEVKRLLRVCQKQMVKKLSYMKKLRFYFWRHMW